MLTRGRHSLAPRLSLFYFLDIITAMSGIMILIALYFSTCLREGSPLFPGSHRWQTPDLESELQASLVRLAAEKNRETALREKLRWAELSSSEIRRKLRRLQAASLNQGVEAESPPLDQILRDLGLASLQEQVQQAEARVQGAREEVERVRASHEALDQRVRLAQEAITSRMAGSKGLRLVADGRDTTKAPVVVEVADARVAITPFDQPEARQVMEPGSVATRQLRRRFSLYHPDTHYAFLLVQPSGYGLFGELREQLIGMGFEVGYEGVPEDPRFYMPDVPLPAGPARSKDGVIGEPEPWPVEGRANP